MKIAWLHSHFLLWTGGTKFVYEVSRRVNRQIPLEMYVEKTSEEARRLYRAEGIPLHEINTRTSRSKLYWLFFPFFLRRNVARLKAVMNRHPVFISTMFPMHAAAHKAGVSRYVVYLFEPFAFFYDEDMIRGFPPIKRLLLRLLALLYKPLDREAVRQAVEVITVNEGTSVWIKDIYGRDAAQSYVATDPDFFYPIPATDPVMQELRTRYRGRKIVVHSTDFTPLKRTWDTVRAVEEAARNVPNVRLLITQSNDDKKEIERLQKYIRQNNLEDHIELLGCLKAKDLPYYYSLADVFVYSGVGSGASSASLFVLECMACGTPGIRTDFAKDEVIDGESGFLYRHDNPKVLVERLVKLLTDDALCGQFGQAARKRILEQYSWDAVTQSIVECLQAVLRQGAAAKASESTPAF